jgi:hypothetical protein
MCREIFAVLSIIRYPDEEFLLLKQVVDVETNVLQEGGGYYLQK